MATRPPKHHLQGFTLIEMIATVAIIGIIAGFAMPSLLTWQKPLRDGVSQFSSQLSLIRSKAIASNQAYRIRPKFPRTNDYIGEVYAQNGKNITTHTVRNFVVEYARNCQVTTRGPGLPTGSAGFPNGTPDGWKVASQFDLDLPPKVGVISSSANGTSTPLRTAASGTTDVVYPFAANPAGSTTVTTESYLNWSICYDNRGLVYQSVVVTLNDFQGFQRAQTASIEVDRVGGLTVNTYAKNSSYPIPPDSVKKPVF